ncbi:unnamed protein product [Rhizoctonia solani]|uniref:Peptidase C14 caspase domain-containing protein n=1 Tax=Rhizoctonia solani TaxID=456999 RepID=A0A8H3D8Z9_9AGAM|nr:unnamed protein product [Rhizoctonia solani]
MHSDEDEDKPNRWSRLYGFFLGIDKYQAEQRRDLRGCVSDAESMHDYFENIGVPPDNLYTLCDEEATRERILDAFMCHLTGNPDIKVDDPIIIYFAGHGDRMPAPQSWHAPDGMIDMILPHDASYRGTSGDNPSDQNTGTGPTNTLDADKQYVYGIPDLTLSFLLYQLRQEKGNNITVILDCCYSGSGTRETNGTQSRNSHDPGAPAIPDELDAPLRRSVSVGHRSILEQDIERQLMVASSKTHILLAACQNDEQAQEVVNIQPGPERTSISFGGIFTSILLSVLQKCDFEKTSYAMFFRNLLVAGSKYYCKPSQRPRSARQTFKCKGRNLDRLLFSVSQARISPIRIMDGSNCRIGIGSVQGIVPGTVFGAFANSMNPTRHLLTTLVAKDVGTISCQLYARDPNAPSISSDHYLTILRHNDNFKVLRIWVDEEIKRNKLWQSVLTSLYLNTVPISWAASREDHDVELVRSNDWVAFRGAHLTLGQLGNFHDLEYTLEADQLRETLTAIIYFHFHLKTQNQQAPVREDISMTLKEIKVVRSSGSTTYEANKEDLFGDSVPAGTLTTLHLESRKTFGIELTNNSTENLFPYVLYYNFEDYSVRCLYEPPNQWGRAPLQAGKSIAIGDGPNDFDPFLVDFTDPKSSKEYGAFVLLVFSEWVDIAYLKQKSPFSYFALTNRGERLKNHDSGIWDSLVVRVELVKK